MLDDWLAQKNIGRLNSSEKYGKSAQKNAERLDSSEKCRKSAQKNAVLRDQKNPGCSVDSQDNCLSLHVGL